MAKLTKDQIIAGIKEHVQKSGAKKWNEWYVGISKDARDRLFNGHCVPEKDYWWIFKQAISSGDARAIEDYFINTLGATGGTGGGDDTADYVYAYKIGPNTQE